MLRDLARGALIGLVFGIGVLGLLFLGMRVYVEMGGL